MKNPKIMIDCALGTLTAFFAFPIIMLAVPSVTFLSLTLLFIFPVLSFICGILCGKENGFNRLFILRYQCLANDDVLYGNRSGRCCNRSFYQCPLVRQASKRKIKIKKA